MHTVPFAVTIHVFYLCHLASDTLAYFLCTLFTARYLPVHTSIRLQTLHLHSDIDYSILSLQCHVAQYCMPRHYTTYSRLLHFCTLCQTLGFGTECSCYMHLALSSGTATIATSWLPHPICCLHHTHQNTYTGMHHHAVVE